MNNLPDETELAGNLSKIEHEPMQPTDEDLPTPDLDDMDAPAGNVDLDDMVEED